MINKKLAQSGDLDLDVSYAFSFTKIQWNKFELHIRYSILIMLQEASETLSIDLF